MKKYISLILIIIFLGAIAFFIEYTNTLFQDTQITQNETLNINTDNNFPIQVNDQYSNVILDPDKHTYEYCMESGGKDITPNYKTIKSCIFDNRIFESRCVYNNDYFIITKNPADNVGPYIEVRYRSTPGEQFACNYSDDQSSFKVSNSVEDIRILALENNFLILDEGTSPDPRILMVYDLTKKEKVLTDKYSSPVDIKDNKISYWVEIATKPTLANCPELTERKKTTFGSAIEKHITLNLETLAKTDTGEQRCDSRQ